MDSGIEGAGLRRLTWRIQGLREHRTGVAYSGIEGSGDSRGGFKT